MEPQKTFIPAFSLEYFIDRHPLTITVNRSLKQAIDLMQGRIIGNLTTKSNFVLVITESDRKLLGIIRETDLIKLAATGTKIDLLAIATIMNPSLKTFLESEIKDLPGAIELFKKYQSDPLLIVDRENRLIGSISLEKIVKALKPTNLLQLRTVAEVMNTQFVSTFSDTSLQNIVELMVEHQVSYVVVVDRNNHKQELPTGMITEADIIQFQALKLDLNKIETARIVNRPLFYLKSTDSLARASERMEQLSLQALLVVCHTEGKLLGIIDRNNLLTILNPVEIDKIFQQLKPIAVELETQKLADRIAVGSPKTDLNTELYNAIGELKREIIERNLLENKLKQSEEKVRVILEAIADIVLVIDLSDNTLKIASYNNYLLNSRSQESIDRTIAEFFEHHPLNHQFLEPIQQVLTTKTPLDFEYQLFLDNTRVWFAASISPISDTSVVWVARDISDRKRGEEKLQQANQALARQLAELEKRNQDMIHLSQIMQFLQACSTISQAYQSLADLIAPLFPETIGGVFVNNPTSNSLETVVSWGTIDDSEIQGAIELFLSKEIPKKTVDNFYEYICEIETKKEFFYLPIIRESKKITILYLQIVVPELFSPAKRQLAITVAEQISLGLSNLKLRETLHHQSIRDPLTNLFNRRYLEEYLQQEINRSIGDRECLGIIMLDIDYFKKFNDTFGHDAGDEVLRRVSKFIQLNIRRSDIACRYGGEELITILPGANLEQTKQRAEQIRIGINNLKIEYLDRNLGQITVSIGVSSFPQHGSTPELLIKAADIALYQAKIQGRNRVIIAS